jgi:site-specific recombinase XerD
MHRNDLGGNVFLLMRHTGMRIGACVELSYDCLHSISPNQWAIHVPLGKLKTERMVPVDAFVRDLVHRLRFYRSMDPLADNRRLLAWHGSRVSPLARLRDYLHLACHTAGLPTSIVPHQLRHTYGTEMLRAGVGFAAVMKLVGHTDPGMTNALCGCNLDRSPTGVPTGPLTAPASGSTAQNLTRFSAHRSRRAHRLIK